MGPRERVLQGGQLATMAPPCGGRQPRGQLESASRDVWVIEDAAVGIQRALAKLEDVEGLERYQKQLTQVLRELTELREYLCIPPSFN